MVKVNGIELELAGRTVAQYLDEAGYRADRVAVAQAWARQTPSAPAG